jgi:hypothetical protein
VSVVVMALFFVHNTRHTTSLSDLLSEVLNGADRGMAIVVQPPVMLALQCALALGCWQLR